MILKKKRHNKRQGVYYPCAIVKGKNRENGNDLLGRSQTPHALKMRKVSARKRADLPFPIFCVPIWILHLFEEFQEHGRLLIQKEANQIIPVRIDQQGEKDEHTRHLRILQEIIARLTACDHLIEEEHHMATV